MKLRAAASRVRNRVSIHSQQERRKEQKQQHPCDLRCKLRWSILRAAAQIEGKRVRKWIKINTSSVQVYGGLAPCEKYN